MLRIESNVRLMISIAIVALVVAALLFFGSEDAATDEIIVRSVLAGAVLFAFPFVFLWRFITVPAALESQLNTDLNQKISDLQATVKTISGQAISETAIRLTSSSVSILIERGLSLAQRRIAVEELPGWTEEVEKWELNCLALLRSGISHQDAVAFRTMVYHIDNNFVYKANEEHNKQLNELHARISLLKSINDRFKQHWVTMTPKWRTVVEAHLTKFKGD